MRIGRFILAATLALGLSACGDNPDKACFDTADHARLSDGKIKGMCDCALSKAAPMLASERDKDLLALIIRSKSVPANDAERAREIGAYWATMMSACRPK